MFLLCLYCKINYFEKHGIMSEKMTKFVPKLVLLKNNVARKKKELPLLEKVTITDVAAEGNERFSSVCPVCSAGRCC